ncbi:hypothetical protein K470DRAFT_266059 [Piedraia hortae CBS 480.64]|uniref:Copper-fist domain-containing protein n=1 Tax=Piedraia hortae CBS 480.64 TaxID=1314780 RepID=A0A6A7BT25_9PEZI|nr:hypothetical protein K470DRAFT_266059 [Piedraia hortae CBS 480.64]
MTLSKTKRPVHKFFPGTYIQQQHIPPMPPAKASRNNVINVADGTTHKVACTRCIRGHRSTSCGRPTCRNQVLWTINRSGRPMAKCGCANPGTTMCKCVVVRGECPHEVNERGQKPDCDCFLHGRCCCVLTALDWAMIDAGEAPTVALYTSPDQLPRPTPAPPAGLDDALFFTNPVGWGQLPLTSPAIIPDSFTAAYNQDLPQPSPSNGQLLPGSNFPQTWSSSFGAPARPQVNPPMLSPWEVTDQRRSSVPLQNFEQTPETLYQRLSAGFDFPSRSVRTVSDPHGQQSDMELQHASMAAESNMDPGFSYSTQMSFAQDGSSTHVEPSQVTPRFAEPQAVDSNFGQVPNYAPQISGALPIRLKSSPATPLETPAPQFDRPWTENIPPNLPEYDGDKLAKDYATYQQPMAICPRCCQYGCTSRDLGQQVA